MKGRFSSFLTSQILMVLFFRRNEKILEVYVVNKTGILFSRNQGNQEVKPRVSYIGKYI